MQASKEVGRPIVHEFSREALTEAGAAHQVPPFSVVASNTMDLSVGRSALCSFSFWFVVLGMKAVSAHCHAWMSL